MSAGISWLLFPSEVFAVLAVFAVAVAVARWQSRGGSRAVAVARW